MDIFIMSTLWLRTPPARGGEASRPSPPTPRPLRLWSRFCIRFPARLWQMSTNWVAGDNTDSLRSSGGRKTEKTPLGYIQRVSRAGSLCSPGTEPTPWSAPTCPVFLHSWFTAPLPPVIFKANIPTPRDLRFWCPLLWRFWRPVPPFKDPSSYTGPTQVVPDNLPMIKTLNVILSAVAFVIKGSTVTAPKV